MKFWNVLNKDILVKKKPKRIFRFNENKWILFASLLENGYSIEDCLTIMNVKKLNIRNYIEQGRKIEDIILQGQKGKFYDHLSFFMQFMSLPKSIYCAFQMQQFEKQRVKNIQKKCAYPFFVLFVSFFSIYLFSHFIIPQLIQNFENVDKNVFVYLVSMIEKFCYLLIIIIWIFAALYLFTKISIRFHLFMYKHILHRIPLFKSYISYFLSGYIKELNQHGLSSLQSFHYLSKLKGNRFLVYLVSSVNDDLYMGKQLYEIIVSNMYLDNDFKMYFGIGYRNGNLNNSLSSYIKSTEIKWERLISIFSTSICILSYSFVGVLLISVYQIMLIPLDILKQF